MESVNLKKVEKTYGKGENTVYALRGVDLIVNEGELLMLVGPSGSGKTTLISIIAGILTQDKGEALLLNMDINHLPGNERALLRGKEVGFVFQTFNLIPTLSAAENVAIPLLILEEKPETAYEKARDLLTQLGLSDKLDTLPSELSVGQRQRVAIARSFIHNPRIIVCDEPTSALDHETGHVVLQILKEKVLQENRTVIVVTHDQRILEFADRIVYLEDGQVK